MDNTKKDQKVTEVMQLIDQLIQKEKDKNAEQLIKSKEAVTDLTCEIREAVCFIRTMISAAVDCSPYDTDAISDLLCGFPMITKILMDILAEAEKAEHIVYGVSGGNNI